MAGWAALPGASVRGGFSAVVLGVAAAFLASACASQPAPPTVVGLPGTSWTVMTLNGGGVIPDAHPTIAFSNDKRIAGSTGCNEYSALFDTDGNHITIGALTATQRACEGAHSTEEQVFLKGMDGAATWQMTESGDLEIDGVITIVARSGIAATQPPPTPGAGLGGTSWNLVETGGTADFAHIVPTIVFGADGTVSGFSGCNTFSGTFTTDGSTLRLGPLATTEIGCQRPASIVEADYLNALAGVATWQIEGSGQLSLGGAIPMKFSSS